MNTRNVSANARSKTTSVEKKVSSANRVRPLSQPTTHENFNRNVAEVSPIPRLLTTTERAVNRMAEALANNRAALESLNNALSKALNYNSHSDGDEAKDRESEDIGSEIANTFNRNAIELEAQTGMIRELIARIDL